MREVTQPLTVGVEEEYQIVDAETGCLRPDCDSIMASIESDEAHRGGGAAETGAAVQHELHLTQIEMASAVCTTLEEVRAQVAEVRGRLIAAARQCGAELVAAGTNPKRPPDEDDVTPSERYRSMTRRYQMLARDLRIFGCHVHVSMPDPEMGVQVMNHARPWLPALQALTANSPFWEEEDTGYASYRRELWVQWPMAGPPLPFKDADELRRCVRSLVKAEAIEDATRIYWDVRLPEKLPTIEFRVMDVMTRIEETVACVGLIRALVARCMADVRAGVAPPDVRPELLTVAMWQAARYGMGERLIDPVGCRQVSAVEHIEELLAYVRDPLEAAGDWSEVRKTVQRMIDFGGGAARQRTFHREGPLEHVVQRLVEHTAAGAIIPSPASS
ncbi:carboxylate-amine ligase [Candidatus Laterigemmans baculatus]|uniref:carboxylate-amine ligase n=1 Tax=Candidatus Laterigemmans baculatus TaxID=2770505 RepID=UPI0013DA4917|nr:glutamate--cysteine ligase [Candidatus Laterigemmans baculatus]